MLYCMFYFTCDRSLNAWSVSAGSFTGRMLSRRRPINRVKHPGPATNSMQSLDSLRHAVLRDMRDEIFTFESFLNFGNFRNISRPPFEIFVEIL